MSPASSITATAATGLLRRWIGPKVDLSRPVFVWGTGRCGSYLLYDLLALHPALVYPAGGPERLKKGLWGSMHHGAAVPAPLRGCPAPIEGASAVWEPAGLPETIVEETFDPSAIDAGRVRAAYRRLERRGMWRKRRRGLRILDKCPKYLLAVPALDAVFPDARHVFCLRDPRIVVNSVMRLIRESKAAEAAYGAGLFGGMIPAGYEARRGQAPIDMLIWQTETLIRRGLSQSRRAPDRTWMVRYETLRADPAGETARLFAGLDLPEDTGWRSAAPAALPMTDPALYAEPLGEGVFLSSAERDRLHALDDFAVEIGYERDRPGRVAAGSA